MHFCFFGFILNNDENREQINYLKQNMRNHFEFSDSLT